MEILEWIGQGAAFAWSYIEFIALAVVTAVGVFIKNLMAFFSRTISPILAKFKKSSEKSSGQAAQKSGMKYGRSPKAALLLAQQRRAQMREYIEAWEELIHNKWGPYAISARLHGFTHSSIVAKIRRKKERLQEFDTLEDKAQFLVHQYDEEREEMRAELLRALRQAQVSVSKALALQMNLASQWKKLFSKRSKIVRGTLKVQGQNIAKIQVKLYLLDSKLIRKYRSRTAARAAEIEFFSKEFLDDWMRSFSADIASLELSTMVGNVRESLFLSENRSIRSKYHLEDDLSDEAMIQFLRQYKVPLLLESDGSSSASETLFEMYLRVKLYLSEEMREVWGINKRYLDQLPAPGSLGISHAKYMQLSGNKTWFEMPEEKPAQLLLHENR